MAEAIAEATAEPVSGTEIGALLACLNGQRAHIQGILDGLDEEALRRPVLPSGWNCLGMVHHLALDVEQFWFRAVVAGEQAVIDEVGTSFDTEWPVDSEVPADTVLDLYRREIRLADAVITTTGLDTAPAWWPEHLFGKFRMYTLREVLLHVIAETACHAGHLDAARELIDGRQWLVLGK